MKNIVFLANDINTEYCLTVVQGVLDFFKDKNDIRLIITQVKEKDDSKGTFTFQHSSTLKMITSKDIDGYILLATSFGLFFNELVKIIRAETDAPIITLGESHTDANCYSVSTNAKDIYKEIINHLINKHNCKKIGYFSGNETKSRESYERFEAYKEALKFHNIEYKEEYVLHGNFTRYFTKQILSEKYHDKSEVPFDSIVCANDLTASGCSEIFTALGISIPDEIKIIGFDDSIHAALSYPSISTVNQQIEKQGYVIAELLYKKLHGEEIEKQTLTSLEPIYRQSCGCIDLSNNEYVYLDKNNNFVTKNTDYRSYIQDYYNKIADSRNIYVIFDFINSSNTLTSFCNNIDSLLNNTKMKGISFSLYKTPIKLKAGDDFTFPESVKLHALVEKTNNLRVMNQEIYYNPHETLIPKEFENTSGFFILHPIYNCFTNYGYFLCNFTESKLEIFNIYMKIINQAISQATEYSISVDKNVKLEMEKIDLEKTNSDLSKQSRTDELTKILNRRGFMEYGQQLINLSISMDTFGVVYFADLDGLKQINDMHGHKMGDLAIQLASQAIRNSFRKNDIVGRLSGDEFAVITSDMSISLLTATREKLDDNCKKLQEENNLPFTLSISLGAVEYNKENYYLKELLIEADKSLYTEKEKHHKLLKIK